MKPYQSINLFGVSISKIKLNEMMQEIRTAVHQHTKVLIGYVNISSMNMAYELPDFRSNLEKFNIVYCDGFGVMLGARLMGEALPERFTAPDFIDDVMQILIETDGGVFLLGSKPGIAALAGAELVKRNPGLKLSGTHHGYYDKTPGSQENESVVSQINTAAPALLLMGFGNPLQEEWILQNWDKLDVPVALMTGAMFDTLSGTTPRAPKFVTDHGLEWLSRLLIEPRRMWRRYLVGNPLFFLRILIQKLGGNKRNQPSN